MFLIMAKNRHRQGSEWFAYAVTVKRDRSAAERSLESLRRSVASNTYDFCIGVIDMRDCALVRSEG